MTKLERLYGLGAAERFARALTHESVPTVTVDPFDSYDDSSWLFVRWEDGSKAVIQCWSDQIHVVALEAATPGRGLYSRLAEVAPAFLESLGVPYLTAIPHNDEAATIIRKRLTWSAYPDLGLVYAADERASEALEQATSQLL